MGMLDTDHEESKLMPLVSVVIPTRNRPQIVLRAITSVLRQTYTNLEVVVVIDGPDPATLESLSAVTDTRLRVVALDASVGGSEVRNTGVRASSGKWVAMLDDDDEWREDKIQKQLEVAEKAGSPYVMVFSRMKVRFPDKVVVLPRRLPRPDERMCDYLFVRKGISFGEGFLQTSSFFTSRQMFMEIPFRKGQQKFQDTDWLLRASAHPEATIEVIAEPLVTYYMDSPNTVSKTPDWEYLYKWGCDNRQLFSDRAFSFLLTTVCIPRASKQKVPFKIFAKLMKECIFDGSPTLNCIFLGLSFWFMPETSRQNLRDTFGKWKNRISGTPEHEAICEPR
jgi:glycosyltransferase involved in cell wall biosynthesis